MKSRNFVAGIAIALSGCATHPCVEVVEPHSIDVLNAGEGNASHSQDRKIAGHFAIVFDDSIKKRANTEQRFMWDQFIPTDDDRDPWGRQNWVMKWSAEDAVVTSFRQLFTGLFERTTDYATAPSPTIMQQQALRGAIVVELTQFDVTVKPGRRPSFPLFKREYIGTTRASFRISVSAMQGGPTEIVASAVGTATESFYDFSTGLGHLGCVYGVSNVKRATSRSIEDAIRQVLIQVSKQISESPTLRTTRAMQGGSPSFRHRFRLGDRSASSANAGIGLGVLGGAQKVPCG